MGAPPAVQYYPTSFGVLRVGVSGRISLVKAEEPPTVAAIDRAARAADTAPTDAQKEAGNYTRGHVRLHGLDVTIENPKGSTRSGVDRHGKRWSVTMRHHYGYIKRTEGADGDHVDVFIGPHPESDLVFVIDQIRPDTGRFDEHKVVLGARTRDEAKQIYLSNYQHGWRGLGAISEMDLEPFKDWLANGDTTEPVRNRESLRQWHRDLRAALGQTTAKAATQPVPRLGLFHRLAEALVKARRRVQRPGSRGGRGYYDTSAEWHYGEPPRAVQMVSPNVSEGLSTKQAIESIHTQEHQAMRAAAERIDRDLNLRTKHRDALGDWSHGVENSLLVELPPDTSWSALVLSTAMKAKTMRQVAAVVFQPQSNGPGRMYQVEFAATQLAQARGLLDKFNIEHRTIERVDRGTWRVTVAAPDDSLSAIMVEFGSEVGSHVAEIDGRFELIGDPEGGSRGNADRQYDQLIAEHSAQIQSKADQGAEPGLRRDRNVQGTSQEAVSPARGNRPLKKSPLAFLHLPCRIDARGYIALARADPGDHHARLRYLFGERERVNRELWYLDEATTSTNPMLAARRADLQRQLTELDLRIDELRTTD